MGYSIAYSRKIELAYVDQVLMEPQPPPTPSNLTDGTLFYMGIRIISQPVPQHLAGGRVKGRG